MPRILLHKYCINLFNVKVGSAQPIIVVDVVGQIHLNNEFFSSDRRLVIHSYPL